MHRFTRLAAIAGMGVVGSASMAHAGPGWEFTSPGNSFTDGTWDFATAFTANRAVTVSGLGYDGFWGPNIFVGAPGFTAAPEPASIALLGIGLIGIGLIRRRRN